MSNNGWTPERRKKQSEMIKNWKPWENSTGPKSKEGKDIAKMNAEKHGMCGSRIRVLKFLLKRQAIDLEDFTA